MKTPEQMAEEWCETWYQQQASDGVKVGTERAFLAGYQAGRLNSEGISLTQSIGVQAAKDQLADGDKVMPQWISVKERLPEDRQDVLACVDGQVLISYVHGMNRFSSEWALAENGETIWPTHWMPLPEPPGE